MTSVIYKSSRRGHTYKPHTNLCADVIDDVLLKPERPHDEFYIPY